MESVYRKVLDAIAEIIQEPGPWKDKYDRLLKTCDAEDKTNLEEFIAWFPADPGDVNGDK